jgi:replicative DNA helicase
MTSVEDALAPTDVELSYIGACLTDPRHLDDSTLTGDLFENPQYGIIFDRMLERHRAKKGVSQALLSEDFPQHVRIIWGSTDYFSELAAVDSHHQAIHDRALRRRLKASAIRINEWAGRVAPEELADICRAEILEATAGVDSSKVTSMLEDARKVITDHRADVNLVPSPWHQLNDVIGGFGPGRMYVIGARPGVGKSAIATQVAYELAARGPVVIASLEMEKGELYSRIVAQQAEIYYGGIRGDMSAFQVRKMDEWLESGVRDIRVLDSGTQSVQSIRSAVRAVSRDGLAGVIVDYIHLLSGSGENETARIANITRGLKQLAMDFRVPVIALSQLNRAVSDRPDGRPNLADLRGSGAIEQDGDVVMFLYRDAGAEDMRAESTPLRGLVAKNRQGPNNVEFELAWQGQFVRATE